MEVEGKADVMQGSLHSLWKVCWEKRRVEASGTKHDVRRKHFYGNGQREKQACIEDGIQDRGSARRSCRLCTFGCLSDLLMVLLPEVEALPLFTQVL